MWRHLERGSSPIDWCEENYSFSPHIAEFINTTSNVLFLVMPPFLMLLHRDYTRHCGHGQYGDRFILSVVENKSILWTVMQYVPVPVSFTLCFNIFPWKQSRDFMWTFLHLLHIACQVSHYWHHHTICSNASIPRKAQLSCNCTRVHNPTVSRWPGVHCACAGIHVIWCLLIVVGASSAYFHATLSLLGQVQTSLVIYLYLGEIIRAWNEGPSEGS